MKQLMRSLFGLGASRGRRTVLGRKVGIDIREVTYIKESSERLDALHQLYNRYRGTRYEPRIKLVWEKTKDIHAYLVARSRLHELELFHLQNTDHFISAFTAIMDAHQQKIDPHFKPYRFESPKELVHRIAEPEQYKKRDRNFAAVEMVRFPNGKEAQFYPEGLRNEIPRLQVPEIHLNTFAKVVYLPEGSATGGGAEIGYTSTPMEKENFLRWVSVQLGISDIIYAGNALVNIPNLNGNNPTGLVPIIHWEGSLYALNLNDFRLFPVKIYRKSL